MAASFVRSVVAKVVLVRRCLPEAPHPVSVHVHLGIAAHRDSTVSAGQWTVRFRGQDSQDVQEEWRFI